MGRKKVGPLTPWEIAKPLLEQDVINRDVTDDMPPRQVKQMRDEYKNCGKSFGSNYRRLQKSIRQHKSRAFKDASAYNHDKQLKTLARYDPNCWEGSEAKALLAEDIEDEMHKKLTPKQLWLLREEYRVFELDVFRPHIYQIERSKRETNYWKVKQKKKEMQMYKFTQN